MFTSRVQNRCLTEQELFLREMIAVYKSCSVLWDRTHKDYTNKEERQDALNTVLLKCSELNPSVDEDYIRTKIDSMRTSFRKEHRKVVESRAKADNTKKVYKPTLWYYRLLLFTVGEESEEDSEICSDSLNKCSKVRIPFWRREDTAVLIEQLKLHPCLYSMSHPNFKKASCRKLSIQEIIRNLTDTTGKIFDFYDVKRKISLIKGQYRYEFRKIKLYETKKEKYIPNLWCYELLSFLESNYIDEHNKSTSGLEEINISDSGLDKFEIVEDNFESDLGSNFVDVQDFIEDSYESKSTSFESEDLFDTIGKNVAHKLRSMTEEQRQIAGKLVNELMYQGQMENLKKKSRISLDGS